MPRRASGREKATSDQCSIEAVYPGSLGWLIRMEMGVPGILSIMSNRVACETLDAMCSVCKVNCATWRSEDADGDGHWTLDAFDAFGQRWIVQHDGLLEAVVLLGEMLGVDWEDG